MLIKKIYNIFFNDSRKLSRECYKLQKNKNNKIVSKYLEHKIYKKFHCSISSLAKIGRNCTFPHPIGIVIGEGVIIGDNSTIYQNVTIGRKKKDLKEYPIIGNNVTIYSNATIIGKITIEDNAIIGCNAVVLRDVKNSEVVYGIVK